MDVATILPPPFHLFVLLFRLALSVFNYAIRQTNFERRLQAEFDIDPVTGFFPPHPLPRLPKEFQIWEQALAEANGTLPLGDDEREESASKRPIGEAWRSTVRAWPVLDVHALSDDLRLLQRAHMVLSWLVSFYVHSLPPADGDILVPKSLAVPLVAVSRCLSIAPVLAYADTILWNCEPIDPNQPISENNIQFTTLFSGTEDERSFYIASARAELRGIEMLKIFEDYNQLAASSSLTMISRAAEDLDRLAGVVSHICDIFRSVRSTCNPRVFYNDIRPWFDGSGSNGRAWVYEGIEDLHRLPDLNGPSGGQSSVMHALDLFLDIDHTLREKRLPAPTESNKRADHNFMQRMRRYMPGKHREYLNYLAASPSSVRELAKRNSMLRDPYDKAVLALKQLRDQHIKIACLYIVSQSHSTSAPSYTMSAMTTELKESREPARGTGGSGLSVMLKAGRDATRRAVLKK